MGKHIFVLLWVIALILSSLILYAQQQGNSEIDEIVSLAKEFVGLLADEDYSGAFKIFDTAMKKAMPPNSIEEAWDALVERLGSFKNIIGTRTEKVSGYDVVFVSCRFNKHDFDIKIVFNNMKQIAGLWFVPHQPSTKYKPPDYVNADSFREKDVKIGSGKWVLPGMLTLPLGDGPFPAIVLVHGSGPHDCDETVGPNKPFRDLAWGLASRGIAVLRYDKRTLTHSTKIASLKEGITVTEETIDDAISAVSLLHKTEKIDTERIFVLGHSLGAMLIPRIGKADTKIAGFIAMAGTTRPLEDVILEQMNYILFLDGELSKDEKNYLDKIKRQVAKVKDPDLSKEVPPEELPFGVTARYWLDLRGYNPPEVAAELKQPILILHGKRDYQVTLEDFQNWEKALSSRKNVEFKLYKNLNHLFMEGEGKGTPAEYETRGSVAGIVIDDITNWVEKNRNRE